MRSHLRTIARLFMASDEFVELQKNQSIAGSSRFLTLGRTSSLANSSALVDFKLRCIIFLTTSFADSLSHIRVYFAIFSVLIES